MDPGNHRQRNNSVSAKVELENGTIVHKHYDELLARQSKSTKYSVKMPSISHHNRKAQLLRHRTSSMDRNCNTTS